MHHSHTTTFQLFQFSVSKQSPWPFQMPPKRNIEDDAPDAGSLASPIKKLRAQDKPVPKQEEGPKDDKAPTKRAKPLKRKRFSLHRGSRG
jgi:hypothetical protein